MVSVVSLGCFRNTFDSEVFLSRLKRRGKPRGTGRTIFINTCAFINDAKRESLDAITEACRLKARGEVGKIVVAGCLVRRYHQELRAAYKEVDAWVDIEGIDNLEPRTCFLDKNPYVFLKIAEGCDWRCSYCAIPQIKGGYRSRPAGELYEEVRRLDSLGFKELIIIAQDTSGWRDAASYDKRIGLVHLTERILKLVKNIQWVRFLYFHPLTLSSEMIRLIGSEPRLCKYIDLPVQHVAPRILRLMRRQNTRKAFMKHIEEIRSQRERIALRTSVIVGFPTETDAEFKDLCLFARGTAFDHLGAFCYSPEEKTGAASLPQVPEKTKKKRYAAIMRVQKRIVETRNRSLAGKVLPVLIEENPEPGLYAGRTQYDAPQIDGQVWVRSKKNGLTGKIVPVTITNSLSYDLEGVYA